MFPNLSTSYIWNTNSILTLVRLQDFNLFSDSILQVGKQTREVAVELWETNQDQKPGDLQGHQSLLVTFICEYTDLAGNVRDLHTLHLDAFKPSFTHFR